MVKSLISPVTQTQPVASRPVARRLGLFDAVMLVMGGTVGSGIFMNPYVVARQVHTPMLVLGAWIAGGVIALTGAFIYAELADRMPHVGGQYAYLRETYHPLLAFLYGWVLLLVIHTGGMAAVTVTFAKYFLELSGLHAADWQIALVTLNVLIIINYLGVRTDGTLPSVFMVIKIFAILMLVVAGGLWIKTSLFHLRPV